MGTGSLSFGIMSKGFPFWIWLLGRFGECKWICCNGLLREEWPQLQEYTCVEKPTKMDLSIVEVLLFDGPWGPNSTHDVWSSTSINIALWIGRSHCSNVASLQQTWSFSSHVFHHASLGGMTDGTFQVSAALRKSFRTGPLFGAMTEDSVPAFLSHILNPLVTGQKIRKKLVEHSKVPQGAVILSWRERFGQILAPTVFSRDHLIQRQLTESELLTALDVPAQIRHKLAPCLASSWATMLTVPCKVRLAVLDFIDRIFQPSAFSLPHATPAVSSLSDSGLASVGPPGGTPHWLLSQHHTPGGNPCKNFLGFLLR